VAKARKLRIEFSTESAFRSEYASNIAKGGIFVATRDALSVREPVTVEISLAWCDRNVVLEGEVVHVVPLAMEAAGATPGVAVQFVAAASELRQQLEPLVGAIEGNERVSRSGRRAAPRFVARVVTRVTTREGDEIEGRSRDLSSSGVLLALAGETLPVGDAVGLCIEHPQTGEQMCIDGTVVRHLVGEDGEVTALGVEFHTPEARQSEVYAFVSDVRAAEHSRRLGSISGPIAEFGIENLLQMFGSSSPRGTLVVMHDVEEGVIVFEAGALLVARLGTLTGLPALERMLRWRNGTFEFHSRIDELEKATGDPVPLGAALLDALCHLDESNRPTASRPGFEEIDLNADIDLDIGPSQTERENLPGRATFSVDLARADAVRDEIDKTGQAILDLAAVGMTVARMTDVIPESEAEVQAALHALLARGVIRLR
jgi:uncharacterized protein (TIGR02266 family)